MGAMGASGQSGLARMGPAQIHVQPQSNPVHCQDCTRVGSNPVRALVGLTIWEEGEGGLEKR